MQNPFKGSFHIDFYTNQSTIKWVILVVAGLIGIGSIIYTGRLVDELKARERDNIVLWTKAIEFSSKGDLDPDDPAITFIYTNIIAPENSIPVILVDSLTQNILLTRNLEGLSQQELEGVLEKMKSETFRVDGNASSS